LKKQRKNKELFEGFLELTLVGSKIPKWCVHYRIIFKARRNIISMRSTELLMVGEIPISIILVFFVD
jgi:hypothetical protein